MTLTTTGTPMHAATTSISPHTMSAAESCHSFMTGANQNESDVSMVGSTPPVATLSVPPPAGPSVVQT